MECLFIMMHLSEQIRIQAMNSYYNGFRSDEDTELLENSVKVRTERSLAAMFSGLTGALHRNARLPSPIARIAGP
jgi:hypothetical protein